MRIWIGPLVGLVPRSPLRPSEEVRVDVESELLLGGVPYGLGRGDDTGDEEHRETGDHRPPGTK
jgi:hypothetical protein